MSKSNIMSIETNDDRLIVISFDDEINYCFSIVRPVSEFIKEFLKKFDPAQLEFTELQKTFKNDLPPVIFFILILNDKGWIKISDEEFKEFSDYYEQYVIDESVMELFQVIGLNIDEDEDLVAYAGTCTGFPLDVMFVTPCNFPSDCAGPGYVCST